MAAFGGSWTFIILALIALLAWVLLNSTLLALGASSFDPYPFIFLNLILSMLAALQAPIIMMSRTGRRPGIDWRRVLTTKST